MEAFLMMGENYISDAGLGRACHNAASSSTWPSKSAGLRVGPARLLRAMADAGFGREAVVIAVKAER